MKFHEENFSHSRCLKKLSIQQLPNQTMRHLSFKNSRPKHNSNVPFQFIALVPFNIKHRPRNLCLPCHCCKPHHNFIPLYTPVPEAGLMLIRRVHLVLLINSRKLFTIPLRLKWLIQQVRMDNRRYDRENLTKQKKNNLFSISDGPWWLLKILACFLNLIGPWKNYSLFRTFFFAYNFLVLRFFETAKGFCNWLILNDGGLNEG